MICWDPKFDAYAREHGRSPVAQLAADEERYGLGDRLLGYSSWLEAKRATYRRTFKLSAIRTTDEHRAFLVWLGCPVQAASVAPGIQGVNQGSRIGRPFTWLHRVVLRSYESARRLLLRRES